MNENAAKCKAKWNVKKAENTKILFILYYLNSEGSAACSTALAKWLLLLGPLYSVPVLCCIVLLACHSVAHIYR